MKLSGREHSEKGKTRSGVSVFFRVLLTAALFGIAFLACQSWMNSIPVGNQPSGSVSSTDRSSRYSGKSASCSTVGLTQRVCAADYSLMVSSKWNVKKTDPVTLELSSDGHKVGSVTIRPYYPSEPVSQLFDNHTEVLSQKKLSGLCLPATEVLLRHTQPAASGDTSYVDKYHIYFITGNTSYELCFITPFADEKTAIQIAGSFQIAPVKIIDSVPKELTSVCGDIIASNAAFFKEPKNYVLFGSLKSDPRQGVAVVFKNEFSPKGKAQVAKKYLSPKKCGSVKAVCGGGKDSIADVTAADGYEWIFNLYNGFTGGHASAH